MTQVNTQGNNTANAVGITINSGQVAVGKLISQLGNPFPTHLPTGVGKGIGAPGGPWVTKDTMEVRTSTGQGVIWRDVPLKDVANHVGRLAYPRKERERVCYGYRPLLAELNSPLAVVKLFPDSSHFVFAMFGKDEIEIFGDATEPTTEEIHALVMFNGKWLTLLKYLEKAELIDV